ncbi:MAG: hypothetical protein R6X33_14560 [Candidatus Brocadiia bacterium]
MGILRTLLIVGGGVLAVILLSWLAGLWRADRDRGRHGESDSRR